MGSLSNIVVQTKDAISRHCDQLRQSMVALRERVREVVAENISKTVAAAIQETVYALSADLPIRLSWQSPRHHPEYRSHPPWQDPEDPDIPPWEEEPERLTYEGEREPPHRAEESFQGSAALCYWSQVLASGLQAAAWWLRRQAGNFPVWAAVGLGLLCSLGTLVAGPSLVHSAWSVAALAQNLWFCTGIAGFGFV